MAYIQKVELLGGAFLLPLLDVIWLDLLLLLLFWFQKAM